MAEWQEYFRPAATSRDQVAFEYLRAFTPLISGEVHFSVEQAQSVWDGFKLKLLVVEQPDGGFECRWLYDSSRLLAGDVARWAEHFQILLAAAVENPDLPVRRLPLLTASQRQQVVADWNQTTRPFPALCLHQLFEQEVERTPERTAVACGDSALTYRQLNERANQLAHHLRTLGVVADSRVGLCLDRSTDMLVAVLAILKAGGAYVPLQADHPKTRLAQQLEGTIVVITEAKFTPSLPSVSMPVLVLDRDSSQWAAQPTSNPASNTTPENLVYIIYTSGSTGVPKGVAICHQNLVNYSTAIVERLELGRFPDGLTFATVSTLAADLGNTSIYPALISGGTLHVIPYDVATDAKRYAEYSTQHKIDVLKIVPSHLAALLAGEEAKQILPRQYLLTGGETLTRQLAEKVLSFQSCELLNHYGPTETTVGSLTLRLKDCDWRNLRSASLPIGQPLANTRVYVLDADLQPVPIGVVGELYIAGAGVARGYLNQPERTAERFLPEPFSSDANARMYKTGDLARWLPEGWIEFLGRGDDQVKVRGFRIELGEVEAAVGQLPGVKQTAVLAREDEPGEKRLVAYVVAKPDARLTQDTLKAQLKDQLPDYMVPSAMVVLDKLPLTANGKVDRQALPAPEAVAGVQKPYVAPRNATEEALAGIWAEVLRKDKISVEDNFFDLGGHSLLATQVVSRVREHFRVELALRTMFEKSTIAELASSLTIDKSDTYNDSTATIARVSRDAYRMNKG
jgi:amino acid adenylation domain-containing protein